MAKMLMVKREVVSIMDAVELADSACVRNVWKASTTVAPPCKKCQKERSRNGPKWKQKSRQKPTKANTPIVIQLKDSLKAALRQKQRSLADNTGKCKDVEISVNNEKDELTTSIKQLKRKNDVKQLSALISVIEKSNRKDRYTNFTQSAQNRNSKLVADYVLNNASYGSDVKDRPRNITDCENVDIICNDLNSSEKSSVTTEDTESENGSTISSSEIQSDSDQSLSNPENPENPKMSKDELEKLARFTTGCPLIRFDCPPSECPQCLSELYNTQYYYNYGNSAFEFHKDQEGQTTITLPDSQHSAVHKESEETSSTSSESSITPPVQSKLSKNAQPFKSRNLSVQRSIDRNRQLLDIDITGRGGNSSQDLYPDSVFIDLTDTDVTYTVFYEHEMTVMDISEISTMNGRQQDSMANFYATSRNHSMSEAMLQPSFFEGPSSDVSAPHWYWPYMYPPMYSLVSPLCVPLDSSNIPKTQMIPPHQLKACKYRIITTRYETRVDTMISSFFKKEPED